MDDTPTPHDHLAEDLLSKLLKDPYCSEVSTFSSVYFFQYSVCDLFHYKVDRWNSNERSPDLFCLSPR